MIFRHCPIAVELAIGWVLASCFVVTVLADPLELTLRYQVETDVDSDRFHQLKRTESWDASRTAIIVCDMWDSHHSINAVRRVNQIAPRLNEVLKDARARGVTIIHAPSDCMDAYRGHHARRRAANTRVASRRPPRIAEWCSAIPSEEQAEYPIDQTDGGEDDDPLEHKQWVEQLKQLGKDPGMPWEKQNALLEIDPDQDYITDLGDEVWNILEFKKIQNVILTGVHTNMCVVGRPFGLRQMVRAGKRTVLMRDMTDTMYNPERWPYVSHFTGTDRVIDHIERRICATITSDQFIGGRPMRFRKDIRPHVVMLIAEKLYDSAASLPRFANDYLGSDFRVTFVYNDSDDPNRLPGIDAVAEADLLVVSVRRRALPSDQLAMIRAHVSAGKPVIGLRTASHAFSVRKPPVDQNAAQWNDFDAEVFGGNYDGHHPNDVTSIVRRGSDVKHALLENIENQFPQGGSLYKNDPLRPGAAILLTGHADNLKPEPVAWTYTRADGGRSFYTSLGHPDDFKNSNFVQLLDNAVRWAVDLPPRSITPPGVKPWKTVLVPVEREHDQVDQEGANPAWYRAVVYIPERWDRGVRLRCNESGLARAWLNGEALIATQRDGGMEFEIDADTVNENDANLLVVRLAERSTFAQSPELVVPGEKPWRLTGRWQHRNGDDPSFASLPLPAKFAAPSDIVFIRKVTRESRRTGQK